MNTVLTGILSALVSAAAFAGLKDITEKERRNRNLKLWLPLAFVIYAVSDTAAAFAAEKAGTGVCGALSLIFAANFIFLLGVIDIRHRRIPNVYIAAAAAVRIVFILVQGISEHSLRVILLKSVLGLAAGMLITGLAWVISGKGMGSGDVKMFAAIGFFTGGFAVIDIIVYSTVFCCFCGILLMIFRKFSVRDTVPMAPFAYAGTMLYLVAGM